MAAAGLKLNLQLRWICNWSWSLNFVGLEAAGGSVA